MLHYATELSKAVAGEKIFKFIEAVLINKTDIIMTYTQVLEKRDKQTERMQLTKNMLSKLQLNVDAVQQATGLKKQELDKLRQEIELN